jgi:hypothetical protein
VFIGEKAGPATWFHELGHVLSPRIDKERMTQLGKAAQEHYPVVSSENVSNAVDPDTLRATALPKGIYLNINGKYCGLDHSGPDADAVNDEVWAIVFSEHCSGFGLPVKIGTMVSEIIASLSGATE